MEKGKAACSCGNTVDLVEYFDEEYICLSCKKQQNQILVQYRKGRAQMYPEIDLIADGIYLGNEDAASMSEVISKHQITAICVCGSNLETPFQDDPNITYLKFEIDDFPKQRVINRFQEHYDWMKDQQAQHKNILIHCAAGVSRSATFTIAFFMKDRGISWEEAKDFVKSKRNVINPNTGFRKQLEQYEKELQSKKQFK